MRQIQIKLLRQLHREVFDGEKIITRKVNINRDNVKELEKKKISETDIGDLVRVLIVRGENQLNPTLSSDCEKLLKKLHRVVLRSNRERRNRPRFRGNHNLRGNHNPRGNNNFKVMDTEYFSNFERNTIHWMTE